MVIKKAAALICVFLIGCAAPSQRSYDIKQTAVTVTLVPYNGKFVTKPVAGEVIHAESDIGDGFCDIRLKKYPKCLLHEIRHCFEGDFHPNESSDEDC